jgi:hypothetical protein
MLRIWDESTSLPFIFMASFAQIKIIPCENEFYQHSACIYLDLFTDGLQNTKIYGTGEAFGHRQSSYEWVLRKLNSNNIIFQSANPTKQFYGASVSKVFVAGGLPKFRQWNADTFRT